MKMEVKGIFYIKDFVIWIFYGKVFFKIFVWWECDRNVKERIEGRDEYLEGNRVVEVNF